MIIHVPFRVTLQGNPSQFSVLAGSGEIPGTDRRKLALVLETLNNGRLPPCLPADNAGWGALSHCALGSRYCGPRRRKRAQLTFEAAQIARLLYKLEHFQRQAHNTGRAATHH